MVTGNKIEVWIAEIPELKSYNYYQSVLSKGKSLAANSGTKAADLPKGRSCTANSGTKVAVLLGMNRGGSFPFFPHPTLSLASEQILKVWKDPRGLRMEVRRVDLVNWALRTLRT